MNLDTFFKEKLNEILFLEITGEAVFNTFKVRFENSVHLPVKACRIVDKVKQKKEFNEMPISFFVEGMLITIGCDDKFIYFDTYIKILKGNLDFVSRYARKTAAELVGASKYIDAYIILKGLVIIENSEEIYSKLIYLAEEIRKQDSSFKSEEIRLLQEAKKLQSYADPYYYEAVIFYGNEEYRKALSSLQSYIDKVGSVSEEITDFKRQLEISVSYELGKEQIFTNPEDALRKLLPLLEENEENALLYFHIGTAYRVLGNNEKAIYYLNEALALDSAIVEIVNELGLNYACIGDYSRAIQCFKKAFEATQAIEICTNLISSYINVGDSESALLYIATAKKINPSDEIVIQLDKILKGEEEWS